MPRPIEDMERIKNAATAHGMSRIEASLTLNDLPSVI
jgi:hypothetical protein